MNPARGRGFAPSLPGAVQVVGVSRRVRAGVAALAAAAVAYPGPGARAGSLESLLLIDPEGSRSERIISQAEWAAELVDALGLSDALPQDHGSADLFTLLCADRAEFVSGAGRRVPGRSALRVSAALPPRRERGQPQRVVLAVPATAIYQVAVEGAGAQRWSVDGRAVGHVDPSRVGVGHLPAVVPLAAGPHELAATVTPRGRVERVELSAFRTLCIAPAEGWSGERPLTYAGKARTLVHAMGLERRLPVEGDPIPIEGERYASASASGGPSSLRLAVPASSDAWARAAGSPSEFSYRVRLDRPGLYTLLARVHGRDAQIWSIDGRYRLTLAPGAGGDEFAWSHVFTLPLGTGEHVIRALLPRGAGIDLLQLRQRRAGAGDYLSLLDELGFREGAPDERVSIASAEANLGNPLFVERARGFLPRLAGAYPDPGLDLVTRDLDQLYSRPLSPTVPPEL